MSARSRSRRSSNAPRPELARQRASHTTTAAPATKKAPQLPEWHWRTFPVFFAFSLGGFVGLYLGILVNATANTWFELVVFLTFAIMLGWALSRMTTRWTLKRKWARQRARLDES